MLVNCKNLTTPYYKREGALIPYMNDIKRYDVLTPEEERELLVIAKTGTLDEQEKAITTLVNCNQRLVLSIAKKYSDRNDLLDIINEANLGLIEGIRRFDLSKSNKLMTYAVMWILKYINEFLSGTKNMVVPASAQRVRSLTSKVRQEFFIKNERYPTLEEIADILREKYKFNVTHLKDLESFQSCSLDSNVNNEDNETFADTEEYNKLTATNNIDNEISTNDAKLVVKSLLASLNDRDKFIITGLFGIGCEEKTYKKIALEVGLTPERVRQKHREILTKLTKLANRKKIITQI